ncbi:NAD-dependent epimerase/dehydratase [Pedobacter sp. BAL39]|uniref:NAD(P)-dependent oxidoreductase n=1 Tax=Pedobacter sp. BAL39 TaxID=391596 RepID=UPI000155978E|nr:NAD(P)H-binding protein [Pedobacter sp. BAL39]EDM34996.1 NAD-dependent epimerase/dehydratase [Pedobacter sp. BAL39]
MKVSLIGASGFVGSSILKELTDRGHEVVAIARDAQKVNAGQGSVTLKSVDVSDVDALASAMEGTDAVISAYNAGWTNPNIYDDFIAGSKAIQEGVKKSGVKRLIVIGGAGSLFIDGKQLVDGPDFPAEIKPGATAARDYLDILKSEKDLQWTFFSPAIEMHQGITTGRTGHYRLGTESPVFNEEGRAILSVEDLALVIVDELENHKYPQQRFTAAY